MSATIAERVHGPRSYLPAIEQKYGKPIDTWWMALLRGAGTRRRAELITWLMRRHGMVYGYASALVDVYLDPSV